MKCANKNKKLNSTKYMNFIHSKSDILMIFYIYILTKLQFNISAFVCFNYISFYTLILTFFLTSGQEISVLQGHTAEVIGLQFSSDGNQIITGSFDNNVKLWDTRTAKYVTNNAKCLNIS